MPSDKAKSSVAKTLGLNILPTDGVLSTPVGCNETKTQAMAAQADESIGQALQRRAAYGKVTPESIAGFLESYKTCGIIIRSALSVNLSTSTITKLRKNDPVFAEMMDDAKAQWVADHLDTPLREIGIEGILKPIFNQKTGALMGHERVIHPQVTLAYARKFDPAYREKQELEVNHSGGVMVVNAQIKDAGEWAQRFANTPPGQNNDNLIDTTATPLPPSEEGGKVSPPNPSHPIR